MVVAGVTPTTLWNSRHICNRRQRAAAEKITAQVAPDVRGVGLATGAGHDDRGVAAPTNVAGAGDGTLVWYTVTLAAAVAMAAREVREVGARDSVLSLPRTLILGVLSVHLASNEWSEN